VTRLAAFLLGVAMLATIGCGDSGDSSEQTQTATTSQTGSSKYERPEYIPKMSPYGRLSEAMKDSLRRYKAEFNIYRDEYWPQHGGVLANDYFRVWYPPGRVAVTHGMRMFIEIMPARKRFEEFFGRAPEELLAIRLPMDKEQFKEWTGRDWWQYGELKGDSLTFQEIFQLVRRGIANYAVAHEYNEWAVGRLTNYGAPRWLESGIASYLAREGDLLESQLTEFPPNTHAMAPARVDSVLLREETKQDSRIAYYQAHRMVTQVVDEFGEDGLRGLVLAMGDGYDIEEACRMKLDVSYEELLQRIGARPTAAGS
jgi:hypothetical protein